MRHALSALIVLLTCLPSSACMRLFLDEPEGDARRVGVGYAGPLPGGGQLGQRCNYEFDCEEPLKCEDSKCVEPDCRSHADCESGRCDRGECAPECRYDFDCGFADGRCQAGRCIDTSCNSDEDNPSCAPYGCDPDTQHCRRYCLHSRDCAKGYVCDGGCVPACTRADDPLCEGGLCDVSTGKCQSNLCVDQQECAGGYVCEEYYCLVDLEAPKCSAENASVCGSFACKTELGHCATHCSSDADCPSGKGCAIAPCDFYSCYPGEWECRPKCTATDFSVCGGYRCDLDTLICKAECYDDAQCAPGHVCNLNDHTCEASGEGVRCTQDSDCGAFACGSNGKCFSACESNADCGSGATCEGIRCTFL